MRNVRRWWNHLLPVGLPAFLLVFAFAAVLILYQFPGPWKDGRAVSMGGMSPDYELTVTGANLVAQIENQLPRRPTLAPDGKHVSRYLLTGLYPREARELVIETDQPYRRRDYDMVRFFGVSPGEEATRMVVVETAAHPNDITISIPGRIVRFALWVGRRSRGQDRSTLRLRNPYHLTLELDAATGGPTSGIVKVREDRRGDLGTVLYAETWKGVSGHRRTFVASEEARLRLDRE